VPKPNRPDLALLRGKAGTESIDQWVQAFSAGDRKAAREYAAIVARFTGRAESGADDSYMGAYAPGTRRQYAHSLTEFFEWIATKYGRVIPPPLVTRKDVEDYVQWLTTRPFSLEAERLRDGDQEERRVLYESVRELGSADRSVIASRAPAWLISKHPAERDRSKLDLTWLHRELGRMVLHDLLVRTPTLDELREDNPKIGLYVFTVTVPVDGEDQQIDLADIFVYSTPKPMAVSRSTVSQRLAALSAFWKALAVGENTGEGALVRYNIIEDVAHRVRHGISAERRAARARRGRLTPQIVDKLLRAADGPTLVEKRDAALLWFLLLTGARITETTRIRRGMPNPADVNRWPGWFDGRANPPMVELTRKGGHRQRLPYPPYALKALYSFQTELERHAPLPGTQSSDPNGPHYLAPTAAGWRYQALLAYDAPLFPPVSFWGNNNPVNYQEFKPNPVVPDYRRPMTRHGVDALLKRIASKAELSPEETALVHGHALRHFAATAMTRMGKPIRHVQQILGHSSVVTTETYVEPETSPEVLSGQNEILDYISGGVVPEPPAPPEPTAPRTPPSRPPVVETRGVAVPKRERSVGRPPEPSPGPAEAPRIAPEAVVAKEGRLVEIAPKGEQPRGDVEVRDGVSPPSPISAYAGHAPKLGPQSEEARLAQQEPIQFSSLNVRQSGDPSSLTNLAGSEPVKKGDAIVVRSTGRKGKVVKVLRMARGEVTQRVVIDVGGSEKTVLVTDVKRDLVQQNPWLRKNYDPWPQNYGLGEGSLLPWFASGTASSNGEVLVKLRDGRAVYVPPLPVLATPQMEQRYAPLLWKSLDDLRTRWLREAPSKALGLDRWWGTFLAILRHLQTVTGTKFRWVPFDESAKVGKDIRAHDEQYLASWLELNSDRFTATVRAFEDVARLRGEAEPSTEEWANFQRAWQEAAVLGASPAEELPDWFMADDPVHEIAKDPEEWSWFVKWLGAVTGQQPTSTRKEVTEKDALFASSNRKAKIEQARELLRLYYDTVTELRETAVEDREEKRAELHMIRDQLAEYGVPDPQSMLREGTLKKRQARDASIEKLLSLAFPEADVSEVDPNVLKSKLFDAETFRLDADKKTIVHTPEFQKEFSERYDGRDSECVVRRAARGMWEHVKRHGLRLERGAERTSEYSLLYSVMLSYAAWIFPCPAEVEQRMAKRIADGAEARMVWLKGVRQASHRIARLTDEHDTPALIAVAQEEGLDRKSATEVVEEVLVAATVQSGEALPGPERTAKSAEEALRQGVVIATGPAGVVIRRRKPATAAASRPKGKETERERGFSREEILEELGVYLDQEPEEGELQPNRIRRGMTLAAFSSGCDYIANAESALPSALRMMTAMTLRF